MVKDVKVNTSTFSHQQKRLLVANPIIIPEKAEIFIELVNSPLYSLTTIQDSFDRLEKLSSDDCPRCRMTQLFPVFLLVHCYVDSCGTLPYPVLLCSNSPYYCRSHYYYEYTYVFTSSTNHCYSKWFDFWMESSIIPESLSLFNA